MSDTYATLLPSLDIAAFEQMPDGSFHSLAPLPAWFGRLVKDGTFPFLGHILDEASAFWSERTDGTRAWGPCTDTAEDGTPFDYIVKAVRAGARSYLVFQPDEGAERLREVLQKVRDGALRAAGGPAPG
jgi:hypothetical protein